MNGHQQVRSYFLQGTRLQVCCSPAMSAFLGARFHLLPSEGDCTETVFFDLLPVHDTRSHAVERPDGEGRPFYEMPSGEALYFEDADTVYLGFRDGVRALYDPRVNHVWISLVESEPKNLFMASHLMFTILLTEVLKRRGSYSFHAAGFSENGRALLIAGMSGAGKSTLSLALLRAGFGYLADDMLFLRRRPEGLGIWGMVEDVSVGDEVIGFFPELNDLLQAPRSDGPKRLVGIEQHYPGTIVAESYPKAIVLPRISGKRDSVLTKIEGDQALLELVANVLLTQQLACQAHLSVLAELVKQAACYRLETGQDFDCIPSLLREILSGDREKVCV